MQESRYFEGVGRRKRSTARVRITPSQKNEHTMTVNGVDYTNYFSLESARRTILGPLNVLGTETFTISVHVRGGGVQGQADAIQLGLARALELYDSGLHKQLKDNNYLTRDPRVKERKKPGLKKARRSPQWSKR
jgi:small subunit ribosomal protein S9